MASQAAHVIYADEYLKRYPKSPEDANRFILGTLFPDIRRIESNIKRSDTHYILDRLDSEFDYLEPFQAGWKFHLYCDMKREEVLNKAGFYKLPHTEDIWRLPNKLLEDRATYEFYKDWENLIDLLNHVPVIETNIRISHETIEAWYAMLAKYFEKKPDSESARVILIKQPSLAELADDVVGSMDKLEKNGKVVKILQGVKDEMVTSNQ